MGKKRISVKLFVTGGSGFLGLEIVRQLCAEGHEVITYSRRDHPELKKMGVTHIQNDLLDYQALQKAMNNCEAVFHVAAKTGIWGKYKDFYNANVIATENVLRACRDLKIRNLIFTSSASVVYNGTDSEGQNESLPYPKKFNAHYPHTKAIAEKLVMAANDDSFKTVSLRPHLVWGPGDPHFLPRLLKKARTGNLRMIGNANNLVDCTYIFNAARAHVNAFDQLLLNPTLIEGKSYFISQDKPIPIRDLINQLIATDDIPSITRSISPTIARIAGKVSEAVYRVFGISTEPPITLFLAQQLSTSHWYDISASKKDFGYSPEISIEEGMKQLKEWIKSTK